MLNSIKKVAYGIVKCGLRFIRYNYLTSAVHREKGCYLYPYRGSIVKIARSAKITLHGDLRFNAEKYKGSKAESYLVLEEDSSLTVEECRLLYRFYDIKCRSEHSML